MKEERFSRLEGIFSDEEFSKLKNAKIIIFGVGGVGGYALETLVRSGVERITIVDFDKVNLSNINRQIIATSDKVDAFKVDVAKDRAVSINGNANISVINQMLTLENIDSFKLEEYDFIIDAIDMLKEKTNLIVYSLKKGLNIISSMGAGNKRGLPSASVLDIFKTSYDGLAKRLRKALKDAGIKKYEVVSVLGESVEAKSGVISSYMPFPAVAGITLASRVIDRLIK